MEEIGVYTDDTGQEYKLLIDAKEQVFEVQAFDYSNSEWETVDTFTGSSILEKLVSEFIPEPVEIDAE